MPIRRCSDHHAAESPAAVAIADVGKCDYDHLENPGPPILFFPAICASRRPGGLYAEKQHPILKYSRQAVQRLRQPELALTDRALATMPNKKSATVPVLRSSDSTD